MLLVVLIASGGRGICTHSMLAQQKLLLPSAAALVFVRCDCGCGCGCCRKRMRLLGCPWLTTRQTPLGTRTRCISLTINGTSRQLKSLHSSESNRPTSQQEQQQHQTLRRIMGCGWVERRTRKTVIHKKLHVSMTGHSYGSLTFVQDEVEARGRYVVQSCGVHHRVLHVVQTLVVVIGG